MKNRKVLFLIPFLVVSLLLSGCERVPAPWEDIHTIADLAYDKNINSGYTVYIEEHDEDGSYLEPYYVLTNDYGGNTLLLRMDVLEEPLAYTYDWGDARHDESAYYPGCIIDEYLKTDFLQSLSCDIVDIIINSEIVVTKKVPDRDKTETIMRKIFILSAAELDIQLGNHIPSEGSPLTFFEENPFNKQATLDGDVADWWLRSPYLVNYGRAMCIFADRKIGPDGVSWPHGIRPAFCLPSDTPVSSISLNDASVYIITNTNK